MGRVTRLKRRLRVSVRRRRRPSRRTVFVPWVRLATALALIFVAGVAFLFTPSGCSPKSTSQSIPLEGRQVRVRIIAGEEQVSVRAQQPPVYFTGQDSTLRVLDLPPGVEVPISWTGSNWRVGNTILPGGELVLRPVGLGTLAIKEKTFRGQYRLVPVGAGSPKFDVVNDVHIDDYLKSVLPRELFPNWHPEAYRAQAIAARTYALYEKNAYRGMDRHFDLYNDVRSQVYGGLDAETPKSREAVTETAGVVLAHGTDGQERIFKAYFSACCGGVGQSAYDAFENPPISPLGEKSVGNLCAAAPRFNWGPVVESKSDLTARFQDWGGEQGHSIKNVAMIKAIEIDAVNTLGRPVRYRVIDVNGNRFALSGEDLRRAVNHEQPGEVLFSSFIERVINEPSQVRFVGGHGHGHGVGMCQYCTQARATAGMRHESIVLSGYPGAKLVRAY